MVDQIESIMTKEVVSLPPDMPLSEAIMKLGEYNFDGFPVLDEQGKLIGLFTERQMFADPAYVHLRTLLKLFLGMDYYKKDNSKIKKQLGKIVNLKVKDLMNPNPPTVNPGDPIDSARQLFSAKANNPLPVVDNNDKVLGVVSMSDMIKFYGVPMKKPTSEQDLDRQIDHFVGEFEKQFLIVSKFRAKTWFITSLIFMLLGFSIAMFFILRITQK